MKEMIDTEARNAHVDSPSQVMGNTFPIGKYPRSPLLTSPLPTADWDECPTTSCFKCPQMTADCPHSGSKASWTGNSPVGS